MWYKKIWPFKKKVVKNPTPPVATPTAPPAPKLPEPTHYEAIMEIVVVNNNTDKQYTFKSQSNQGMCWSYISNGVLCIDQNRTDTNVFEKRGLARLSNFSIVRTVYQTFPIKK